MMYKTEELEGNGRDRNEKKGRRKDIKRRLGWKERKRKGNWSNRGMKRREEKRKERERKGRR